MPRHALSMAQPTAKVTLRYSIMRCGARIASRPGRFSWAITASTPSRSSLAAYRQAKLGHVSDSGGEDCRSAKAR